jgi:hypothetical protein
MDLAGPFNKWKVDFLTDQYSTDKSSKARHYPSTNTQRKQRKIPTDKKLLRVNTTNRLTNKNSTTLKASNNYEIS